MSYKRWFRSASVDAGLALLAMSCLGGCALPMHCGDARVTYPRHDFFRSLAALGMIREGYDVELPAIPLSQEGTAEFRVSKLPPGAYDYEFSLSGGSIYGDEHGYSSTPAFASHAKTVVSFRTLSPEGKELFNTDIHLGDLKYSRDKSTLYPTIRLPGITATDFRLIITVRHPSSAPNEEMHIDGFGGGRENSKPVVTEVRSAGR